MLIIKSEINSKMIQTFNHEPYPDIILLTASSKLNLATAYLSIDSAYFASLQPDISEIDLSHLPEQALLQVLKALYGDKLIAQTINQLEDIYRVISYLEIDDYKQSMQSEMRNSEQLIENLQVIQFCFQNQFMLEDLKKYHFQNNLRALEDNRNFLQLNKITVETLICLLIQFHEVARDEGNHIINNIMENYFNRNSIRAADFFDEYDVESLLAIWEIYHHTLQNYDRKPIKSQSYESWSGSSIMEASMMKRSSLMNLPKKREEILILQKKCLRIQELENEIQSKNRLIDKLSKELQQLKKIRGQSSNRRGGNIPAFNSQEEQQLSILEGVKNSKKQLMKNMVDEEKAMQENAFEYVKNCQGNSKNPSHKPHTHQKISRPYD